MQKKFSYISAAILAILFCAAGPVSGATGTWINAAGGSWPNPANWSGGTIPGAADDTADFSTLSLGSAPVVTLDGATTVGNLVFGDVGNSYGWTLVPGSGDPLTLAVSSGSPTITVNNQTNKIGLVLDGTQGLTKAGNGTLVLSGANTFLGPTFINGGTLQLGDGLANNGVITDNMSNAPNATLVFANPFDQTYTGIITNSGSVVQKGPGALILGVGGQITGTNSVTIAAGSTLYLSGLDGGTGNNRLPSAATAVWNISGTLRSTTSAANTMPPSVILNGGTMTGTTNCYANFGTYFANGTTITANGAGNNISLPGGAFNVGIGVNNLTLNTPLAADALLIAATIDPNNAAGRLAKSGAGTVTLTGINTYTASTTISNGTLTLGGAGQLNSGVYAGLITNNGALNYSSTASQTLSGVMSGTGSLTNSGPGTLTLFNANTYSGPTILNGGTTVGVTAGACGRSSVTVASSAATLSVSITNNTRNWSCTNLTFDAAGTLDFNFGTITPSASVAPLVVSNAVAFTATPAVTVRGLAFGTLPIGSYPLMTWASVSGTVPTAVTLPPHRGTATLSVTGNTLYLNITSLGTQPLSWAASSGAWDIGLTANWKDSANATTTFLNFDSVVFEDTISGAGPITVTLATNVAPGSVAFTNSAKTYTLAGSGITGLSGLVKAGTSSVVLVNTNTYTGGTTVSAGTLQLGDGVANNGVVAGGIAMSSGATVAFANPNDQTYGSVISGSGGAVVKSGAGTLSLTVSNTYSGGTMINAGTMQLLRPGSIPASGTATINTSAMLLMNPNAASWAAGLFNTNISLNGGTLAMTADSRFGRYITGIGATNVSGASSFITVTAGAGAGSPPNLTGLFLDNGLTGSGTITISSDTAAVGVGLRTPGTRFSGTLIVNGNPSTISGSGSGLAVGSVPTQPTLTNADLEINGTMEMGNAAGGSGWANGTVNGLTLAIGALNGTGVVVANMPTAGFTRGLNIGGNNHNGLFSGQIDNGFNDTLSLTKSGSGTQALTGANTYTGTTTVNGGTLQVNSPGSLQSPVSVQSGGTLGGNGTLSAAVNVQSGGTLTVGTNSALATLAINNALTFAANSTNVMRISKTGGVATNDQVTGLTSVTYGGTLRLVDTTTDSTPLALGDTFILYPSAVAYVPGGFGNVILPALPAGLSWNLNNLTVDGSISINNQVSTPLFSPAGGGYAGAQSVTISSATPGATIRYTTDGSTPNSGSPVYSSPITVPVPTVSMTIRAYATKAGFVDSAVGSATYATVVTPTWLNPVGGNWSDTSSWLNTVVANGSGVAADFSTLTLSFGPVVQLDTPATVGALVFADQGNVFTWTLGDGGAGPLTLDNGISQPVINVVNTETIIGAGLAGTNGFIKTGAGSLTLSGPNTYTGTTTVNSGVGELKFTAAPSFTTFTGNGTIEFNFGATLDEAGTFGSGFTGQINITGVGTEVRTVNSSVMSANLGDVYLDSSARWTINNSPIQVDDLTGSGLISTFLVVNPQFATLVLGANNGHGTNAVFSGPITSGNNGWISIVKNGTGAQQLSGNIASGSGTVTVNGGTLTFAGTNTYTGATTVSNGTLIVAGSLAAGSAVYVASAGTLGGTGTVSGAVTLDGTVSPGTSVGQLTVGGAIIRSGSVIKYEVASASNSALRDLLTITNTLDLSQLTGSATIRLVSMANATTPGLVPDFDGSATYTWVIGTAGTVAGAANLGNLVLDTSAFANTHPGTFSLALQGNSLVVNYGATPLTPPTFGSFGPLTGSSFPLTFSGPNGQTYKVLGSTNVALPMASWWQLSSGTFGAGPVTFTDTTATNANRFYRIVSP